MTDAGEELVAVPRSLLGAACAAIRGKRNAPNTLSQLNRYAVHGPALAKPASSPTGSSVEQDLRARIDELLTEREFLTSVISKSHEPHCALWSDEPADCDCRASSPAGGDVRDGALGWNSPEEWEIEQRAFHAAGRDDVPKDVQELVAILWKQYCIAAEPSAALSASTSAAEPVAWMSPAAMHFFWEDKETAASVWNRPFEGGIPFYTHPVTSAASSSANPLGHDPEPEPTSEPQWQRDNDRIRQLMRDVGMENSQSLYQAFKQIVMETRLATPPAPAAVDGQRVKAPLGAEDEMDPAGRIRACLAADKEGA